MIFRIFLTATLAFLIARPCQAQEEKAPTKIKKVKIRTIEGLRFEPARFSAKPGETLELIIENHDPNDQPHNFVLSMPGSLQEIQTASMAIGPESVENGFVPKSESILIHSKLLNPEEKDRLTFKVPKEKGVYPYLCTFPGHALVMYGAFYVDTKYKDDVAYDTNIPELVRNAELEKRKALLEVDRPSFQRLFMPNAGPAAIAVALPGKLNYCWDAGNCRLRYAWTGAFVDATKMWNSNGNALAKTLGNIFWQSLPGETALGIHFGDSATNEVKFRGYDLVDGLPRYRYEVDGHTTQESLVADDKSLLWSFKIDSPPDAVLILMPPSESATISGTVGNREGNFWKVPKKDASHFTLKLTPQ